MTEQPDHELAVLEIDQTVPPRPEEEIADLGRDSDVAKAEPGAP